MSEARQRRSRWWVPVFAFSCLAAAVLLAVFVWPTPYQYIPMKDYYLVRVNRFTGERYGVQGQRAWKYLGKPQMPDSLERLGFEVVPQEGPAERALRESDPKREKLRPIERALRESDPNEESPSP